MSAPHPADNIKCNRCKWWEGAESGDTGLCRRYAPRPYHEYNYRIDPGAFWPVTDKDDYCGEFRDRFVGA